MEGHSFEVVQSIEETIYKYGCLNNKKIIATSLDQNGKLSSTLTYGKLYDNSLKIAHYLLHNIFKNGCDKFCLDVGSRVALVYPNNEPVHFMCAFYGCVLAGIVPIAIEVPVSKCDPEFGKQVGCLLTKSNVQIVLSSSACLKTLARTPGGEVANLVGWPAVQWVTTDSLPNHRKEWLPTTKHDNEDALYIEYSTNKEGNIYAVVLSEWTTQAHCRMLTARCQYSQETVMVCTVDFKREVGLWHSVLTSVLNGIHVIFVPHSLVRTNPSSWLSTVAKYKATAIVTNSQHLQWSLNTSGKKGSQQVDLSSVRLLLVGDGQQPSSYYISSRFYELYKHCGLGYGVICPCAASTQSLTVSIRNPGKMENEVLRISRLTYGVTQETNRSIKAWNCGELLPDTYAVVLKIDGPPYVCNPDEVGQICVFSQHIDNPIDPGYDTTVVPLDENDTPIMNTVFTKTNLLGVFRRNTLYLCGSSKDVFITNGCKHTADDIALIVLTVEPEKITDRSKIAVFSVTVLQEERVCIVVEQYPGYNEDESYKWMLCVVSTIETLCQLGVFCIAIVPACCLPKDSFDQIRVNECKRRFLQGTLHPINLVACPQMAFPNLGHSSDFYLGLDPAADMVGASREEAAAVAEARGCALPALRENITPKFILETLERFSKSLPNTVIYSQLNSNGTVHSTLTYAQLMKQAERIASLLVEKANVHSGDHVAIIFPPGIELVTAFYGCLYVGAVPVPVRPPIALKLQVTLKTVRYIVEQSNSVAVLSTHLIIRQLKSEDARRDACTAQWPLLIDIADKVRKDEKVAMYKAPTDEILAYLNFSINSAGKLVGIKMSHREITNLCRALKLACEFYLSRPIVLCLLPYSGLAFVLWSLCGVYSGLHSVLIDPSDVYENPPLWISTVSHYKSRDTFCSYAVLECCTENLKDGLGALKSKRVSLAGLRTCIVITEEKPRLRTMSQFRRLFSSIGLNPRALTTSFGCPVNVAIGVQTANSAEPGTVHVDSRSLRWDDVSIVEEGSPHSITLVESANLLPGVKVIVVDPITGERCNFLRVGEIWVQSDHNSNGYFYSNEEIDGENLFTGSLSTENGTEVYARTGYLGFLKENTSSQNTPTIFPDVTEARGPGLFIIGDIKEMVTLGGMKYHPSDIEEKIVNCHPNISECIVIAWTRTLVVIVALSGEDIMALDLIPLITTTVLEEFELIVNIVAVANPATDPLKTFGEKYRMHIMDDLLSNRLDPIYVAYNL